MLAASVPLAGCGGAPDVDEPVETDTAELDAMADAADAYEAESEGDEGGGY